MHSGTLKNLTKFNNYLKGTHSIYQPYVKKTCIINVHSLWSNIIFFCNILHYLFLDIFLKTNNSFNPQLTSTSWRFEKMRDKPKFEKMIWQYDMNMIYIFEFKDYIHLLFKLNYTIYYLNFFMIYYFPLNLATT